MNLGIIGSLVVMALAIPCHAGDLPVVPKDLAAVPASQFCKAVERTTSGDGKFAVAFAPTGKPVKWEDYKDQSGGYSADPQADGLANFLVDLKKDRATALLPGKHFGTQASYNHERCTVAWSEKGKHLVVMQSWKWHTAYAGVYALSEDGAITAALDLLPVAKEQLGMILAKNHKVGDEAFKEKYAVGLAEPVVTDDGKVTIKAWAEVPKTEDPPAFLTLRLTVRPEAGGKLAMADLRVEETD